MPHILVIDDNDVLRSVTVRLLTGAGYQVRSAGGGIDGLREWREHGADLVITDFRMPDLTGAEVVRALREAAPALPIIVTSGDAAACAKQLRQESLALTDVQYLGKPYLRADLLDAVATALRTPPS